MTVNKLIGSGVAIGALIVAVAAGAIRHSKHTGANAQGASAQDESDELRFLRERIAHLEATTGRGSAGPGEPRNCQTPAPSPAAPEAEQAKAPPAAPPKQPAGGIEYVQQADQKFQAETVDPAWSEKATGDVIRSIAREIPAGSRLGRVECRADLCRIESSHESMQAFDAFLDHTIFSRDKKPWNGAVHADIVSQSPNDVRVVSFLAREGYDVPAVDSLSD